MSPWRLQAKALLSAIESRFSYQRQYALWCHIALPITFSLFMIEHIHTLDKQALACAGGDCKAAVPLNS
jgi:hypothetical protein